MALLKVDGFFSSSKLPKEKPFQYILFDVFGTVVDVRGTLIKEFNLLFTHKHITHPPCEQFVETWINAYSENMAKISDGTSPFATVDELNMLALDKTLQQYQIYNQFNEIEREQMCLIWHRLTPWPDSVPGLKQLKEQFKIGTLSNGNIRLLEDLSKHAAIDWDILLSGELFGCYKPNPSVYLGAAQMLKINPSEILLVASHKYDLEAARQCGFQTAYIFRPFEFSIIEEEQIPRDKEFDFVAEGINVLAEQLNCANFNLTVKAC